MWTIEIDIRLKDDSVTADAPSSDQTITVREQLPGWQGVDQWERSVLRLGFGLMRTLFRQGVETYQRELLAAWVHRDARCQVQQRGSRPLTLTTAFGRVALSRKRVFCRRCGVWSVPLNDALDLRPRQGRTTRAFRELVCLCGSHQPYRLARRMVQRVTQDADAISVKGIERILHSEGARLRKIEERAGQEVAQRVVRDFQDRNPPAPRDGILYLCLDSTFVRSHQGRNRWREGKVGYVCTEARAPTGRQGKQRIVDPCFVSTFEKIDVFTRRVYTAAIQHDYRSYSEVIVLGDGAQWIRRMRRHCFPRARYVLDWYHLHEKVGRILRETFPGMRAFRRRWSRHITDLLWTGRKDGALFAVEELRRRWYEDPSLRTPRSDDRAPYHTLDDLITYLRSNWEGIVQYEDMQESGYLIASSLVEKAVDLVISKRQKKRQGMHWSFMGADAVAALRTLWLNERWEDYWHKAA